MKPFVHGVLLLVVSCLLASSMALAEGPPDRREATAAVDASARFQRGVELFKEGAYRGALVEFQRAYELAPDHRVLYNIGLAQVKVQDYLGAAQSYERYLAEGGTSVPSERRARVEQALAELRMRVGRVEVYVDREGATVLLDDVKVGTSPLGEPLRANVGRHLVQVRASDGATESQVIDVAGDDTTTVAFRLGPESALDATGSGRAWTPRRKAMVATAAAGGLLLVGGAVAGVLAWRANRDLDDVLAVRDLDRAAYDEHRDALRVRSLTADVLLGVGAATVVTAAVLWLVGSEQRPREPGAGAEAASPRTRPHALRVGLGVGRLAVSGTF